MIFRNATVFNFFIYHFPKIFYFFKKNKKGDGGCNREREERETTKEALKVKPATTGVAREQVTRIRKLQKL